MRKVNAMTEKHDPKQQQSDRFRNNRASDVTENDLANEKMGKNKLQGNDQANVRNQRKAQPDAKSEADSSVIESLEKMDKDIRAKRDLGKGNRS
jgi:hypothetical protein